ncbi:galactose mutarotase isoform X1 [Octopus bimaculoides]|uniref:galactose mutarotase isoform X1 n=2 Tax=Octopus bimaculoides TaxID=37653 RepID=UPI00071D5E1A|nr:galactose mutarotase isoform X1 [Octopus bimaculoides]|eukprot:XP_014776476.1 PREDICTED: aldose 1-epimerase-like [Octopus bimaculoides]
MSSITTKEVFGYAKDGTTVERITLKNASRSAEVEILTFGAIISKIIVPDKNGDMKDIVLGFENVKGYEDQDLYIGGIIGRVTNRIANGQFTIDGTTYKLDVNSDPNTLHGGFNCFDKVHWKPSIDGSKVSLTYVSPCGQSGFPGELTITVTYELTDDNCLKVDYMATTTKATPINLTNHAYFNLGGHGIGNLSKHWLIVPAAHYLPVDKNCLVTGEIRPVDGTPMDLRKQVLLSEKFKELPDGYDHTYCFGNLEKKLIALVWHEETERSLKVSSTQPGVHVYTGYFLNGPVGKDGAVYKKYSGLCLETQHYPNSVNEPKFPNTVLYPGETFRQTTWFQFGVLNEAQYNSLISQF